MKTVEFSVKCWMGIVKGWRPRNLIVEENGFKINRIKDNKYYFPKENSKFFSFKNALVIDTSPSLKQNKNSLTREQELIIETTKARTEIRANSKKEKLAIKNLLQERIKEFNSKTAFSDDYENYRNEIARQSISKTPWDLLVLKFTYFQNLFNELNQKLDAFYQILVEDTKKPKIDKLIQIHSSLLAIKDEMKMQFDDLITKAYDYKDVVSKQKKTLMDSINEKDSGPKTMTIEDINMNINKEINIDTERKFNTMLYSDSFKPEEISDDEGEREKSLKIKKNAMMEISLSVDSVEIVNNKEKTKIFSEDESDFYSELYNKPKRVKLNKEIKCGTNMIKEFIKAMTAKKGALPIDFNEPLSMLQKQCERFYYDDLLKKANDEESKEMQLSYIASFIIGEIFLNIGRFLKPFNPILGETYEYYDNEKHFRFFSEQVSHAPPISAFIGETMSYAYFGDSRSSTSFKLLKGCLELSFGNKTHVLLKKSGNYYTFNKPILQMKGLLRQQIRYDYTGEITIQNVNNTNNKCVITFFEEGKKPLGTFEGKVYTSEGEVAYLIQGNWKSEIYLTDPDGNNKKELLKIEEEPYIQNSAEVYTLPIFSCCLNETSEELNQVIPDSDSRLRPDLREYEEGSNETAQEMKMKIEDKQRQRHQKFEEDKVKYTPHYFYNTFNDKSRDEVYMFNGEYWNDRKNKVLKSLKDSDIFMI